LEEEVQRELGSGPEVEEQEKVAEEMEHQKW